MDDAGDAQLGGLPEDRAAHIAAGTHTHIRAELLDDPLGLHGGGEHPHHRLGVAPQVLGGQLPLEAGDVHGLHVVAGLGHQALLHAALVPHVEDLGVRFLLQQVPRRRQGGVDVPRRAAPCEQNFHSKPTSFLTNLRRRPAGKRQPEEPIPAKPGTPPARRPQVFSTFALREMFSKMPICPSSISSAVPP